MITFLRLETGCRDTDEQTLKIKKQTVEYNTTRQCCTKRRDTIPGDRFWDFSLFIDVIVSVCEATSGMKRNAVGSCVRLKKWKGEGLDNTVNPITPWNPKRVFKCSDFASCNIIFFPNAKSGTCHL